MTKHEIKELKKSGMKRYKESARSKALKMKTGFSKSSDGEVNKEK